MVFQHPLCTASLLVINVSVHIVIFLTSPNIFEFAIHPGRVWNAHEYYRLITSAFVHGGVFHILMNMMSLLQLGGSLEPQFGTYQFLFFTLWAIPLSNCFYVFLSWILAFYITGDTSWMVTSGIGYSGVLFSYAVLESYHSSVPTRSVFGIFNVPAKLYPWILLLVLQFMIPNISFMGHLSGIIIGSLCVMGCLSILLPSYEYCQTVFECLSHLNWIKSCSNFHFTASRSMTSTEYTNTCRGSFAHNLISGFKSISSGILVFASYIWYGVSTVLYIFGFPVDAFVSQASAAWQKIVAIIKGAAALLNSYMIHIYNFFSLSCIEVRNTMNSRAANDNLGSFALVSTIEQTEI